MLRILNKKLPKSKKIVYSLIEIYGINIFQSKKICKNIGLNPNIITDKIKNYHSNRLKNYIKKNLVIENFLKEEKKIKIKLLLNSKNIRGIRKYYGLPVNGQRTHTNAKTSKKFKNNNNNIKRNEKKK